MKRIGMIIIIVGLFTILSTTFPHVMREKVSEFKKLEKTNDKEYTENWQLYAGIGMIVVGGIVLVLGVNRKDEKEILKK